MATFSNGAIEQNLADVFAVLNKAMGGGRFGERKGFADVWPDPTLIVKAEKGLKLFREYLGPRPHPAKMHADDRLVVPHQVQRVVALRAKELHHGSRGVATLPSG